MRLVVSGVPRGYQTPRPDGNWLQEEHRRRIEALSPEIKLGEFTLRERDRIETGTPIGEWIVIDHMPVFFQPRDRLIEKSYLQSQ